MSGITNATECDRLGDAVEDKVIETNKSRLPEKRENTQFKPKLIPLFFLFYLSAAIPLLVAVRQLAGGRVRPLLRLHGAHHLAGHRPRLAGRPN